MSETLSRDEFRKLFATASGRAQFRFDVDANEAAGILADDMKTDSWYRIAVSIKPKSATPRNGPLAAASPSATTPNLPSSSLLDRAASRLGRGINNALVWLRRWSLKQRLVTVVIVAVALGLSIGAMNVVQDLAATTQLRQQAAEKEAASQAAQADAAEKAENEEQARLKKEKEDHAAALRDADATLMIADAAIAASPWGEPSAFERLVGYRAALEDAVAEQDGEAAFNAASSIPSAIASLGTFEQSQDRIFDTAMAAAGNPVSTIASAAKASRDVARGWCSTNAAGWAAGAGQPGWSNAAAALRSLTPMYSAALVAYCPELQGAAAEAQTFIADGNHRVGGDGIPAGTWATIGGRTNCYWERHTLNGDILDNDFITAAPDGVIVTIYEGEGFSTERCGLWRRTG